VSHIHLRAFPLVRSCLAHSGQAAWIPHYAVALTHRRRTQVFLGLRAKRLELPARWRPVPVTIRCKRCPTLSAPPALPQPRVAGTLLRDGIRRD